MKRGVSETKVEVEKTKGYIEKTLECAEETKGKVDEMMR
jgi:hypothetical protein